jgi:outer membrane protein OmpA-like peptidoglycan-associated protein
MTSVLPPQTTPNGLDVFFANNSTRLTAGTQQGIMRWYTGLGPGAQMQLRTGQWPIQIQGFASPSGRYEYNMALSNRRAQAVASFLRSVIGQGAQINVAARGEITQGGDEARQRRVSIIVPLGR